MNRLKFWALIASILAGSAARAAWPAGPDPSPYPAMAPLEQYLMPDRTLEIAQARHAAPASLSDDADVLVLGTHGYETAVKGHNGFVCLVQRSWFSGLTDKEFWNPRGRAPICFNPHGAHTVLPSYLKRTEWVLAGASREEIIRRTQAAIADHTLFPADMSAVTYMLAKDAYHSDAVAGAWHPHLMFFEPRVSITAWGANAPGSPIMGGESSIEPFTIFFVPVPHWSDGTLDSDLSASHHAGAAEPAAK
jgi:hypothetical protein